ncbi:unnamed protein product [Ceutorhynchus assimilis]|uniref:Uncharacterized protein n=1 Tax=Ceutorhynchus assimilis TaxID=467358 RepID=A0A9N9ME09_9CUCU|nr:unnamed protein product [Ceutorhynchus assimilis]
MMKLRLFMSPQNILLVVSIILIETVSIVQKEDDMKKVLLDSVRLGQEEALKSAYFDTYKSTPKKPDRMSFFGFVNSLFSILNYKKKYLNVFLGAFKRTNKYACYVREAINENLECSLQCLKYLYKCENFL